MIHPTNQPTDKPNIPGIPVIQPFWTEAMVFSVVPLVYPRLGQQVFFGCENFCL